MHISLILALLFLLSSCSPSLTYEGVSGVLDGISNSVGNSTRIVTQNLNSVGIDYFEVELSFEKDENENNSAKVYICSETDLPGCRPKDGASFSMSRQSNKFILDISGLSFPYDPGDTINYLIVVEDDDGIEGLIEQQSVTLLSNNQIQLGSPSLTGVSFSGVNVSLPYSFDINDNASATLNFCNATISASCDPTTNSIGMSKSGGAFSASLTSLSNSGADEYKMSIVISDVDGVANAPAVFNVSLAQVPATQIFRSVGIGSTAPVQDNALGSLTIVGDEATFSAGVADNIGVGDVITYNTDTRIAFISSRISSSVFEVKLADGKSDPASVTGNNDWKIFRAYTSLRDAEQGTENSGIPPGISNFDSWSGGKDLVSANEQWNIALYADGFEDIGATNGIAIGGWSTSEHYPIKIFTPNKASEVGVSQRHHGVFDRSKYYLNNDATDTYRRGIELRTSSVIIDGLQILVINNGNPGASGIHNWTGGWENTSKHVISNNIIQGHFTPGGAGMMGIKFGRSDYTQAEYRIYNNIFYGFKDHYTNSAIHIRGQGYAYNNTIYNCWNAFELLNGSTILKNNLAQNIADSIKSIGNYDYLNSGNNIFSITDTPYAVSDRVITDIEFNMKNAHDYRLSSTDFEAIGTGLNLSLDPHIAITHDIMGQIRTRWDIGASTAPLGMFRSVGPGNTASLKNSSDHNLMINLNSDGHSILTLSGGSTDVESRVGVGDVIQYDADNIGGVSHLAFIHKRIDARTYFVKDRNGNNAEVTSAPSTSWDIYRAYTSSSNAEAGTGENSSLDDALENFDQWQSETGSYHDLVSKNSQYNIALYADGADSSVPFLYWVTDSLRRLRLFSPSTQAQVGVSQRHTGKWSDSRSRLVNAAQWSGVIRNSVKNIVIEGIQVENTHQLDTGNVRAYSSSTTGGSSDGEVFFLANIFRHTGTGSTDNNDSLLDFGGDSSRDIKKYIINNILISRSVCLGNHSAWNPNKVEIYIYHNTCIGNSSGGVLGTLGDAGFNFSYYKNNISLNLGSGNDWVSNTNIIADFEGNTSSDTSSPSSATFQNVSIDFVNVDTGDFRALNNSSTAVGNSPDLSDDEFYTVGTDILGSSRSAPYDSGAFTYVDLLAGLSNYDDLGAGSSIDPYLIANKSQLLDFATNCSGATSVTCNSNIDIIDDIDMSGETWVRIGDQALSYTGEIDGRSNTISNINFGATAPNSGFIGQATSATIRDLNLDNISINMSNTSFGGILVSLASGGSVDNVHVSGVITSCNSDCGGLVGRSNGSTISNSSANVRVTGGSRLGGLVGNNDNGVINNSFAVGDLVGSGSYIGGLIGSGGQNSGTITNVYALGNVTGDSAVGGLIGLHSRSSTFSNCFATGKVTAGESSGDSNAGGLVGSSITSTGTQRYQNCYAIGDVYGEGNNVGGLIGYNDDAGVRIIENSWAAGDVKGSANIGGLIGLSDSPRISHSFASGKVTAGGIWAGGLVGRIGGSNNEVTTNSFSLGDVYSNISTGNSGAGGFAGAIQNHTVSDSYSRGNVFARNGDKAGGFVGSLNFTATIQRARSYGSVFGRHDIGGFVGELGTSGTITLGASYGAVNANTRVGGFAGAITAADANIANSFSTGFVFGNANVSSFAGEMSGGTLENSYTISRVSGASSVHAIVGGSITGTLSNNYWNSTLLGPLDGSADAANVASEYNPATDGSFKDQATFSGWDFTSSGEWSLKSSLQYPQHRYTGESQCQNENFSTYDSIGSGTLADPYIICHATQLEDFASNGCTTGNSFDCDKNFRLGDDIDFRGADFIGVGGTDDLDAYTGVFDGNHHTISNVVLKSHTNHNALFRNIISGAMIRNLDVYNADTSGGTHSATIASLVDQSYIINVHVKGSLTYGSSTNAAGGLANTMTNNSVVSHSSYEGAVRGNTSVGGLVSDIGVSGNPGHVQKSKAYLSLFGFGNTVGGIVALGGINSNAEIRQNYSTGDLTGSATRSGGISGRDGQIYESMSSMIISVQTSDNVGGLVGSGGRYYNSYTRSSLIEGLSRTGGLGGYAAGGENSYAVVDSIIEGGSPVGKALGAGNSFGSDWVFYDTTVNPATFSDNPTHIESKTTSELKNFSTYTSGGADYSMWEHSSGYDAIADTKWLIDDGQKYPMLRWQLHPICQRNFDAKNYNSIGSGTRQDPYVICFKDQLFDLSINGCDSNSSAGCGSHYIMPNDIDLHRETMNEIGHNSNPFTGTFNGLNNSILNFKSTSVSIQGLFEKTLGAQISNLKLINASLATQAPAGSLVANAENTIFENIHVNSDIETTSFSDTGGVVGRSINSSYNDIVFSGSVVSASINVGGLIGLSDNDLIRGIVTQGSVDGTRKIGGIIGSSSNNTDIKYGVSSASITQTSASVGEIGGIMGVGDAVISQSSSTSTITSLGNQTGGLVGTLSGTGSVSNSFYHGDIISSANGAGLIGTIPSATANVVNSYAIADMSGVSGTRSGIVGFNSGTVSDCFWDSDVSGFSSGGAIGEYDPLSTAAMKTATSFSGAGWSSDIWLLQNGSYPSIINYSK